MKATTKAFLHRIWTNSKLWMPQNLPTETYALFVADENDIPSDDDPVSVGLTKQKQALLLDNVGKKQPTVASEKKQSFLLVVT